ncbi:MAG: hypothetical protein ACW990_00040 [Promethearchaeota archaeon]
MKIIGISYLIEEYEIKTQKIEINQDLKHYYSDEKCICGRAKKKCKNNCIRKIPKSKEIIAEVTTKTMTIRVRQNLLINYADGKRKKVKACKHPKKKRFFTQLEYGNEMVRCKICLKNLYSRKSRWIKNAN